MVQEERARRAAPWPAYATALMVFILLFMPLFTIAWFSVLVPHVPADGSYSYDLSFYRNVFAKGALLNALVISLKIAVQTSVLATAIGTMGALALEHHNFPGKRFVDALTLAPLVMPELVMGLMSLVWFSTLRLSLGTLSITLAHVTYSLSYVLIAVRTKLHNLDRTPELAALDLGAKPYQVFFYVTLPELKAAILAGALMAFTLSFDDFLISFFTAGVNSDTLPIKLYGMIKFGLNREIYAISTMLLGTTLTSLLLLRRITGNKR